MTSSISLKNTMNTAGLEWFGPPERNTLRPLCVVLPCLDRVCESLRVVCLSGLVVYSERLPFISQGDAYMAVGTPTGGPNDVVQDNVQLIILALQAKEISLLDSIVCSWCSPFSVSRRCIVRTAPGIASGVYCHVAERAV